MPAKAIRCVFTALLVLTTAGCTFTPPPQWSREETEKITQRTYSGISNKDVLQAAEKIFSLADKDDFKFAHLPNRLVADRSVFIYAIIAAVSGSYRWIVEANETNNEVAVITHVYANLDGHSAGIAPTTGGNFSVFPIQTASSNGTFLQQEAVYDLFWRRMEYILFNKGEWLTCKEMSELTDTSPLGSLEALCINARDETPE